MKRSILLTLLLVATLGLAREARAQAFGQLTPAETLPPNGHLFGGYLNASENIIGLLAQLRLSFYPNIDFGFQGGMTRVDLAGSDVTTVRVGGDVKFQVARATESFPVDLSLGGALGLEAGDDISLIRVGPTAVASRSFPMGGSGEIVPFAGTGLIFTRVEVEDTFDDTSITVPIRLGSELRFSPEFRVLVEIDIPLNEDYDDNLGLIAGINLPF